MERVMGIEPTSSAWKAEVLPLNYTRVLQPPPSPATPGAGPLRLGPPRPARRRTSSRPVRTLPPRGRRLPDGPVFRPVRRPRNLWWRGKDYSGRPALRPSGAVAPCATFRIAPGDAVEPSVGSNPSPEGKAASGWPCVSACPETLKSLVEGEGFEPSKAEPADLQSAPFDRSGTPPKRKPPILGQIPWTVNRNRGLRPGGSHPPGS
jgi:hypothetical protein